MARIMHFLTQENIARAQNLLDNHGDYHHVTDEYVIAVAYDNTVWMCWADIGSVSMNNLRLLQRLI